MAIERSKKMNKAKKLMMANGNMMYQPPESRSSKMDTSRVTTSAEVAMAPEAPSSVTVVPPRVRSWMRARTRRGMCMAFGMRIDSTTKVAVYVCHTPLDGRAFPPFECSHAHNHAPQLNMNQYTAAPARYPATAKRLIFFKYQTKSIFSNPITATPAAEPMIKALPPVPAQ